MYVKCVTPRLASLTLVFSRFLPTMARTMSHYFSSLNGIPLFGHNHVTFTLLLVVETSSIVPTLELLRILLL